MHCRSCGADLPAGAAYCLQCGARVELGSILGVGTDVPSAARDQSAEPPPEPSAEPSAEQSAEPSAEQPPAEDLSQTRELPRLDPAQGAAAAAASPRPRPQREAPTQASVPAQPVVTGERDDAEPEHSRSSVLAMIATFAVLTIIGTFALTRLIGSGDPEPTAQGTSTATSSAEESVEESAPPSPSTSAASPSQSQTQSASPSAEVSPSESTTIPAEARRCSTSGNDAVATAYAGTDRTSCEFAASVREAYREAGTPAGATSLRAYSPVTKKWYSLSCDGGEPVRCVSTTNAIVILSP